MDVTFNVLVISVLKFQYKKKRKKKKTCLFALLEMKSELFLSYLSFQVLEVNGTNFDNISYIKVSTDVREEINSPSYIFPGCELRKTTLKLKGAHS